MDFIKGTEQVKIDPIGIDISGASNILLKSDGKVGIGTNNPQHPLQVNGSQAIFSNTPELLLFKQFGPGRLGPTLDWGNTEHTDWKIKAEESGLKFMSGSSGVTTESITINNTGNVGIGTSIPNAKLEIEGTNTGIRLTDYRSNYGHTGNVEMGKIEWYSKEHSLPNDYDPMCKISAISSNNTVAPDCRISFWTGYNGVIDEKMSIDPNGNVGIGTTNPGCSLYNFSSATSGWAGKSYFGNGTTGVIAGTFNNVAHIGGHNGSLSAWTNLAINNEGGNVGIGTTNPEAKLDVKGSVYINELDDAREYGLQLIRAGITGQLANDLVLNSRPNADNEGTVFQINGSTKMFLARTGNVGIGITNPSSILTVRGNGGLSSSNANGAIQVYCGASGKDIDGMSIRAYNNAHHIINFCNSDGGLRGKVAGVNGDSVRYDTTSDKRRKENIREMESMIDKVMAMKCRQFNWIEGKEEDYGFIAQEIYEIFPHIRPDISGYCKYKCCDEEEDDDEEDCCCYSNIDEPVDKEGKEYWYGLDYGHFTPYLCKALQESHTKVLSLEQRNNDLEQQVTSLSSRLEAVESILLSLQNN